MTDGSKQTADASGKNAGPSLAWASLLVSVLVPVSAVLSMGFAKWHRVFVVAAIVLFCNAAVGIVDVAKRHARRLSMWPGFIAALASFVLACAALLYANLALHWNG